MNPTVARRFPKLQVVQKLPFKDTSLSYHVETYEIKFSQRDIKNIFFRFYRDKLFYIYVIFDNEKLRLHELSTAAAQLAETLGPAETVVPVETTATGSVERMRWQRDGLEAQLSLSKTKLSSLPHIELHLVDPAIDNETQKLD